MTRFHTDLEILQSTWKVGGFWGADNPDGWNVQYSQLPTMPIDHPVAKQALRDRSIAQVTDYALAAFVAHGREPVFDGEKGPALETMLDTPRCYVPDNVPPPGMALSLSGDPALAEVVGRMRDDLPAVGSGNWANCHQVGNFHSATVLVNMDGIGDHLKPVFIKVLSNVKQGNSAMGLLFRFINDADNRDLHTGETWSGRINIDFNFVVRSSGWIGLAIVGQNQVCGDRIWSRYLSTYRPSNIVSEWTTLVYHELMHCMGSGHLSGPRNKMNPSIVRGLPPVWDRSDGSYEWIVDKYGGQPVGGDTPPPPPPVGSTATRLAKLESQAVQSMVRDAIQNAQLQWIRSGMPSVLGTSGENQIQLDYLVDLRCPICSSMLETESEEIADDSAECLILFCKCDGGRYRVQLPTVTAEILLDMDSVSL
jgi:hypothetical protein